MSLAAAPTPAQPLPARPPLSLELGACLADSEAMLAELLSLELGRPVSITRTRGPSANGGVTVTCEPGGLMLTYEHGTERRQRWLAAEQVAGKALARTVALALVALIEAPADSPEASRPTPSAPPKMPPGRSHPPDRSTNAVVLMGTGRFFLDSSDMSLGARLRSRLGLRSASGLLLGVSAERGRASRAPGVVQVTALGAELGWTQDVVSAAPFHLAIELGFQAGRVVLEGQARLPRETQGARLAGGWAAPGGALAPRVRLGRAVYASAQLGASFMLLGPSASHDGSALGVWRGASLGAGLGLTAEL